MKCGLREREIMALLSVNMDILDGFERSKVPYVVNNSHVFFIAGFI